MMASKKDIYTDKIIARLKQGKTISEISRELLNTNSTASINRIINRTGLKVWEYNPRYLFMNQDWLNAQLLIYKTPSAIAKHYGMPRSSVTRYAENFGLYNAKFKRTAKNAIDESYFDEIDNARKAYWLGFIMADGNIYHYKNSDKCSLEIKISQNDGYLLREFAKDIGFPIDKVKDGSSLRKGTECFYTSFRTYNKRVVESLSQYGIKDSKSGNECFPSNIPSDFKRDFIRGYFDGDGSISSNRIFVCSPSFKMISGLSKWFCFSNIAFTLDSVSKENGMMVYLLRISKRSWSKFGDTIYYSGCFGLDRKIKMITENQSTIVDGE